MNTPTTTTDTTPRAWIGCLGCYNSGRLLGDWLTAEQIADKFPADEHPHYCYRCGSDEWAAFDMEGVPRGLAQSESVAAFVEFVETVEEIEQDGASVAAFSAFCDNFHYRDNFGNAYREFVEAFRGEFDSENDLWAEMFDEWADARGLADDLRQMIEPPTWARQTGAEFDLWTVPNPDGGVFAFWNT